MATEKAKTTATATAKPETVAITKIYVGPTIPGVAIQNRVYSETPTGLRRLTEAVLLFLESHLSKTFMEMPEWLL